MSQEQWSINEPQTLELSHITEVKVALVKGRFDIVVTEGTTTTLEVSEVDGQPLEVSFSNGTLKVEHFNASNWLQRLINFQQAATAVISIAVPAGALVTASTVNADGMVSGSARTTLRTVTGALLADATEGLLTVDTVSGEIIARDHRGTLVTKSVSGDVMASGELSDVRSSTVSGNISLDLHGGPTTLNAKSVSGDIMVRLPRTMGVRANATSASGTLLLDQDRFSNLGQNTAASIGPDTLRLDANTTTVSGGVTIVYGPTEQPTKPSLIKEGF
ncbi:hypothetical protein CVS30_03580 [Arthrobacter psychrolactophilus]|uniref:DUF4097 domain-containing protein n=1 Tax=Arthrobacter psychrolactophilus TaxID=92442 RepID=A0A2V5ITA1_9MICC|nr:DUF4097 family beta strand repeat-containing protein [Arthrobacter psychrolactophilus]PYI39759.1 hypothetical protein CVS30_03580 [Arthrobacter psychrolactophilus]